MLRLCIPTTLLSTEMENGFSQQDIELKSEYRISHLSYALLKILQQDVQSLPHFKRSAASIGSWGYYVYQKILGDIESVQKSDSPELTSFRSYSSARKELEE